jgi:hypothetical protein
MPQLARMRELLQTSPDKLAKLSKDGVEGKASPSAWSAKEELGHLLDSAANNHQRIVRAQLEENPAMPGYEQNRWIVVNGYQSRDWDELIDTWRAFNRQLVAAAESVPASGWSRTLSVAGAQPVTLEFVFDDYIEHMVHHLRHIGIEVNPRASNAA